MRGPSLVAASGGLSLPRPLLLRSTGSRRTGSAAVAHGPSCSAACGILPDQGSNPCPLRWQVDSQPLRHQGSPRHFLLKCCTRITQQHFCRSSSAAHVINGNIHPNNIPSHLISMTSLFLSIEKNSALSQRNTFWLSIYFSASSIGLAKKFVWFYVKINDIFQNFIEQRIP